MRCRSRIVKFINLFANALLTLVSIAMLLIAIFAWIKPPDASISPHPISEHHQYSVAVVFLLCISICIFGLALFGIISTVVGSSFLLSLYIFMLLAQISTQIILSAFAIANFDVIHASILAEWKNTSTIAPVDWDCKDIVNCKSPLSAQIAVERIIFSLILVFFVYQVILLCLNCYYCEVLSRKEIKESIEHDRLNEQ